MSNFYFRLSTMFYSIGKYFELKSFKSAVSDRVMIDFQKRVNYKTSHPIDVNDIREAIDNGDDICLKFGTYKKKK